MFGNCVLICTLRIPVFPKLIPLVHPQRPIISIVFAAVRGSTTIRSTSGALIVAGTTLIIGSTAAVFVFPQDRVRILFSGASFSGPFAGSGVWRLLNSVYRRFRRRIVRCSVCSNRKPPLGNSIRTSNIPNLRPRTHSPTYRFSAPD